MKTTVAISPSFRIVVQPAASGGVLMGYQHRPDPTMEWGHLIDFPMSQAQAGALVWGMEAAAEAARIAQERAAA